MRREAGDEDPVQKGGHVEQDILIGGLLALASVAVLLALMLKIARAVREEPRKVKAPRTAPALRPTSGW